MCLIKTCLTPRMPSADGCTRGRAWGRAWGGMGQQHEEGAATRHRRGSARLGRLSRLAHQSLSRPSQRRAAARVGAGVAAESSRASGVWWHYGARAAVREKASRTQGNSRFGLQSYEDGPWAVFQSRDPESMPLLPCGGARSCPPGPEGNRTHRGHSLQRALGQPRRCRSTECESVFTAARRVQRTTAMQKSRNRIAFPQHSMAFTIHRGSKGTEQENAPQPGNPSPSPRCLAWVARAASSMAPAPRRVVHQLLMPSRKWDDWMGATTQNSSFFANNGIVASRVWDGERTGVVSRWSVPDCLKQCASTNFVGGGGGNIPCSAMNTGSASRLFFFPGSVALDERHGCCRHASQPPTSAERTKPQPVATTAEKPFVGQNQNHPPRQAPATEPTSRACGRVPRGRAISQQTKRREKGRFCFWKRFGPDGVRMG